MQPSETTQLLRAWARGDQTALEQLTPRVYQELRRIASHQVRNERAGGTVQTTALVHEAFLRLVGVNNVDWQHRAHFFSFAAQIMRHILVDRARARAAAKRGGNRAHVNLEEVRDVAQESTAELIALDESLNRLGELEPRKAQVVELRFFGGLSVKETASVLQVSEDTVMRDWSIARAWLLTELSQR